MIICNRFAIDSPEKVLAEARIKQEADDSSGSTKCKKRSPITRNSSNKRRTKYRR